MAPILLFDMDGTLVDTDHLHFAAFQTILAPHGITLDWASYRRFVMGQSNEAVAARLFPHIPEERHAGLMHGKEAEYRSLVRDLEPAPGLPDLLDWADAIGAKCAVVTNAPRESAELVLDALKIRHRFAAVVVGDEIASPKPHPMPYLTALARLGGDAGRAVAFEDSGSGVTSAKAAGLPVVGLSTGLDEQALKHHGAALVIPDYRDPFLPGFLRRHLRLDEQPAGPARP